MSPPSEDHYAPPTAAVEDVRFGVVDRPLASRSQRFFAVFLDGVFIWVCLFSLMVLGIGGGSFTGRGIGGMGSQWLSLANPFAFGWIFILAWLVPVTVQGILLSRRGQTLGKIALNIRIVRVDGSAASGWRTVGLRYLLPMAVGLIPILGGLFGLADSLAIFRASRRCLHDEIADTIVVQV